jgi:hypothetical protein
MLICKQPRSPWHKAPVRGLPLGARTLVLLHCVLRGIGYIEVKSRVYNAYGIMCFALRVNNVVWELIMWLIISSKQFEVLRSRQPDKCCVLEAEITVIALISVTAWVKNINNYSDCIS